VNQRQIVPAQIIRSETPRGLPEIITATTRAQ
jgi:hypothetical protein